MQWSHLVIIMRSWFGDSIGLIMTSWLCNEVILLLLCDCDLEIPLWIAILHQLNHMVTFKWPKFRDSNSGIAISIAFWQVIRWLHFDVTWELVLKQLSWWSYNRISSHTSHTRQPESDLSQSSCHNDFSVVLPNDHFSSVK